MIILLLQMLVEAPLLLPREHPSILHLKENLAEQKCKLEIARYEFTQAAPWELTRPYAAYHLAQMEAGLCVTQAHLAEARGDRKQAAAKWRKVVTSAEGSLEFVKTRLHLCNAIEDLKDALGQLADARCRLAEVERDWPVLKAELPKLIIYLQDRAKRTATLLRVGVISPEEAQVVQAQAEDELRRARALLRACVVLRTLRTGRAP